MNKIQELFRGPKVIFGDSQWNRSCVLISFFCLMKKTMLLCSSCVRPPYFFIWHHLSTYTIHSTQQREEVGGSLQCMCVLGGERVTYLVFVFLQVPVFWWQVMQSKLGKDGFFCVETRHNVSFENFVGPFPHCVPTLGRPRRAACWAFVEHCCSHKLSSRTFVRLQKHPFRSMHKHILCYLVGGSTDRLFPCAFMVQGRESRGGHTYFLNPCCDNDQPFFFARARMDLLM